MPSQYLFVYGTFYPQSTSHVFEAQSICFPGRKLNEFRFEEPDWWIKQTKSIADFFYKAQFLGKEIDYRNYRTMLKLSGERKGDFRQETDTISRLIYGFSSTFMLTGECVFYDKAYPRKDKTLRGDTFFVEVNLKAYNYFRDEPRGGRDNGADASLFGYLSIH